MFKVLTQPMEFVGYGLKSAPLGQNDFLQISGSPQKMGLAITPTTKYFRSKIELAITVRNAHRCRMSERRGSLSAPRLLGLYVKR